MTVRAAQTAGELIARWEKATEPDRELDAEIAVAIDGRPFVETLGCGKFGIQQGVTGADFRDTAPRYTANIDDALKARAALHRAKEGQSND